MAVRFLAITLFFSLVVIKPVHDSYPDLDDHRGNKTHKDVSQGLVTSSRSIRLDSLHAVVPAIPDHFETDYLWMYLVFVYFFSLLAMYMIVSNTRHIIEVRQEYLGSQTTITDRTIRLSGIPSDLQSESKIKEFMEDLDIGKVECVTLCRVWKELDDMMLERDTVMRRLEEAWTVYLGYRSVERSLETLPIAQPPPPGRVITGDSDEDDEAHGLLESNDTPHDAPYPRVRPRITIRYGRFNWHSKQVDGIHYYEEKLRTVDERIVELRKKEFAPTPLAFVTMDSVAACQMAVQAVLDSSPLQLLANLSPAPADVVWTNTYISRRSRMFRAWSITALIIVLTIFWSIVLVPVAGALNTSAIRKVVPRLADVLDEHPTAKSLVQTQLPTLIISLLNVAVPYLYNCERAHSRNRPLQY